MSSVAGIQLIVWASIPVDAGAVDATDFTNVANVWLVSAKGGSVCVAKIVM
jgi:hypothetical protein